MDINAVVEECIPEVLSCAINFLYGQNIPADFNHGHCLLKTADAFLMEDLRDAVSEFFFQRLNMDNVKEVAKSADMFHSPRLLDECHNLVLANIDDITYRELKEIAIAMPSIAEKALKMIKGLKEEQLEKERQQLEKERQQLKKERQQLKERQQMKERQQRTPTPTKSLAMMIEERKARK